MLITDRPAADVEALRSRLYGEVYGPGDAGWDEARRAWNLAVDQRPAAVALPGHRRRRVAVVDFARDGGPARRAAGHRPRRGRARLARATRSCISTQAHARRADRPAAPAAPASAPARSGRTSPAPPPPTASRRWPAPRGDVGVVGYTLGGGLGWLGRKHGFAVQQRHRDRARDRRRAARPHRRATTSPSSSGRCAAAAANFGVVTAIEFELYPVEALHGGRDDLAVGARGGDLRRLARVDRDRPGRGHVAVPDLQVPTSGRARPLRGRSWSSSRPRSSATPRPARPAARARARASTCSPDAARRADRDPQRPEAAVPGHRRPPPAVRRPRRDDRRARRTPPAPVSGSPLVVGRAAPPRRRAADRTPRSRCSPSACRRTPSPRWRSTPRLAHVIAATAAATPAARS